MTATKPATRYPTAYVDGAFVPSGQPSVPFESHAMRYALSVFEGIRGYALTDGTVGLFALDAHLERLARSLELTNLPPVDIGRVANDMLELLARNGVKADCYLRAAVNAVSGGDLTTPVRVSVMASLQPMGRKPWMEHGRRMAVLISHRRKPSDEMFPQRAKCIGNYVGPRLAWLEAANRGFDNVVLLSAEGALSEAPTANLFLVKDGRLATPPVEDGILLGITRQTVIELATNLGVAVEERSLTPADAYEADEAFLCGTGLELAAIGRFDDRALSDRGGLGLFPRLVDAYLSRVRRPPAVAPATRAAEAARC